MKHYYIFFALIVLAACQSEEKTSENSNQKDSTSTNNTVESQEKNDQEADAETREYDYFAGSIGLYGEDVLMEISLGDDLKITGRYWYLKHGRQIELTGSKASKSNEWQLSESVKNVITGHMTLQLKGDQLTGQWYAPGKESELQEVSLKKVHHAENGKVEPKFETYAHDKTITVYNGEEDMEESASDDIRLVRIGDYILFQYFVIGTNAHVGHINGLAKMVSENKAIFKGEESCELSMNFGKNEVTIVEEEDCSYYRGMRAYFGRTLKKKK